MATTVQPTTRERTTPPAAGTPAYRDRNRQLIAIGAAVLVAALIGWFVVTSNRRKEEFAARSLTQARSATEAVITLNQVRMVNGQSELAAVGLRDFLASKPAPKFAAPAYGLLGAALENAQKWSDAGDAFSNAAKSADLDYLRARYLVDAGRSYREGGKTQEA